MLSNEEGFAALDADAEFSRLLLRACVRIKVVGSALLEAIAVTQLGAHENAQGGNCHSHGEPGDHTQGSDPVFSSTGISGITA
jgi:hypothetical protein